MLVQLDDVQTGSQGHVGRSLITGNRQDSKRARGPDFYETPDCATKALLSVERLPFKIWEPACGRGAIAEVLKAYGHDVVCHDLNDWGYEGALSAQDFLMTRRAPEGVQAIVTNPPYLLADQFVLRALELVPMVVMLLRLGYLEGSRRTPILEGGQLARVWVFRNRLPMMHRHGYDGPKVNAGGMAFAWFVWLRDHEGPTVLKRLTADTGRRKCERKVKVYRPDGQEDLFGGQDGG